MSELSQFNNAVLFTNWTQEDFTHSWGGVPHTFRARTSEWISVGDREHNEGLAKFFAKHLTDRELNRRNIPTDHFKRGEFETNCFAPLEETHDVPVLKVEIHKDTGLVAAVTEVAREDVVNGVVVEVEPEVLKEEVKEEKTPAPLKTVTEKKTTKKSTKKEEAKETPAPEFEE